MSLYQRFWFPSITFLSSQRLLFIVVVGMHYMYWTDHLLAPYCEIYIIGYVSISGNVMLMNGADNKKPNCVHWLTLSPHCPCELHMLIFIVKQSLWLFKLWVRCSLWPRWQAAVYFMLFYAFILFKVTLGALKGAIK